MNIFKTISSLALLAIFFSATAQADEKKLADKLANTSIAIEVEVNSCNADAAKLCPGLPLNSKKSFMCLMAYEDNLSSECIIGLAETVMAIEMSMIALDYSIKACEEDADKHCLDVQPGEGRIVSCLRKNEDKLKKSCIAALKETGFWKLGAK